MDDAEAAGNDRKDFSESDNVIEAIFKMLDLMNNHFQKLAPTFQMDMKRFHGNLIENPKGI